MALIEDGSSSTGAANVTTAFQLEVKPGNPVEPNGTTNYGKVGGVRIFSETDAGTITGVADLLSPETDDDYRLRVAHDTLMDYEEFDYTSQNTGKHTFTFTTLAAICTASGITTNSSAINTTATGLTFGTFAMFPVFPTHTTVCETSVSFTTQPTSNVIVDFGMFLRGASTAFAPTDGVYFRLSSAGFQGCVNYNGTETLTGVFPLANNTGTWTYTINTVYKFLIQISNARTTFWVNNLLLGYIVNPIAQNMPCASNALPWSFRHANVGTTGDVNFKAVFKDYKIGIRGALYADPLGTVINRVMGSYQGLSGGTMGGLTVYTNSTNPTAAVPSNTALTANLPSGLGGQAWETATLAVNTDGILMSYQVPAGTVAVPGKRLKVTGVKLSSYIQTAITGGPLNRTFSLNYGHTAVSLATTESASMATATTKKPRVVLLPELTQLVVVTQAINTMVSQVGGCVSMFPEPIYVNPGEFISLSVKHIGTVASAGTIATNIQYVYSWE